MDVRDAIERGMQEERPDVEAAWKAMNPATPLSDMQRARVHSTLINTEDMKRVDAQLAREGKPATVKNRIWRIVKDMQVPQSVPLEAENEARARQEAEGAQVREAGARMREETRVQTEAEKAAAKADRERFFKQPWWEQSAESFVQDQWAKQESALEGQVRARVFSELRQQLGGDAFYDLTHPSPGTSIVPREREQEAKNTSLRGAAEARIRAEVAEGYNVRRKMYDAQMTEARRAYSKYFEAMMGDDGAPKLVAPAGFQAVSFERWLQLRQEGKL
jgi:hypothetical protein